MLKKLSLGAALAALMAAGALAQSTTPEDAAKPGQPATPPAATAPATPPAATAPAPDTSATSTTTSTTTKTESINFKSAMGQNEMLASKLKGMKVRNSAGENLGDLNDIVMDDSGKASVAIVGVGGFLGIGEKDVGVPFGSLTFADANDGTRVARLDTTKEALNSAPTFVYKDDTAAKTTTTTTAPKPVVSQ
jgi:sporulation protein YlmC with PRC-barrel domain